MYNEIRKPLHDPPRILSGGISTGPIFDVRPVLVCTSGDSSDEPGRGPGAPIEKKTEPVARLAARCGSEKVQGHHVPGPGERIPAAAECTDVNVVDSNNLSLLGSHSGMMGIANGTTGKSLR
jgi:hypothetical protein